MIEVLREMFRLKSIGKCPFCGCIVDKSEFIDRISLKEFEISGLCQNCQDSFFNSGNL